MSKGKPTVQKVVPAFKTEGQERKFWSEHDSTEYVDWSKATQPTFPNLKPRYLSERIKRERKAG